MGSFFVVIKIFILLWSTCYSETLTQNQIDLILNAHNEARQNVNPPALTMPDLEWDADVAAVAQGWADKCIQNHNPNRETEYGEYLGENIAMWSPFNSGTMTSRINSFVNEKSDYDYDTNTCATSKVCGHYTQVVWAATTKIGCGLKNCVGESFPGYLVCNYYPGGNYNGQKPYVRGCDNPCTGATDTCSAGTCKCGVNSACSGATPVCTGGTCVAASDPCAGVSCTGTTDTCTAGTCKCGVNSACSGATPICTGGTCFAASDPCAGILCTGTTDTCTAGTCKCGVNSACSGATPVCSEGTCVADLCEGVTCEGSSNSCVAGTCRCGTGAACSGATSVCNGNGECVADSGASRICACVFLVALVLVFL